MGWGGVGEELPGWRKGLLGGFPTLLVQLELLVSLALTWRACTDSEASALPRAASVSFRSSLLQSFEREALLDSNYFFCRQASSAMLAACCAECMFCACTTSPPPGHSSCCGWQLTCAPPCFALPCAGERGRRRRHAGRGAAAGVWARRLLSQRCLLPCLLRCLLPCLATGASSAPTLQP